MGSWTCPKDDPDHSTLLLSILPSCPSPGYPLNHSTMDGNSFELRSARDRAPSPSSLSLSTLHDRDQSSSPPSRYRISTQQASEWSRANTPSFYGSDSRVNFDLPHESSQNLQRSPSVITGETLIPAEEDNREEDEWLIGKEEGTTETKGSPQDGVRATYQEASDQYDDDFPSSTKQEENERKPDVDEKAKSPAGLPSFEDPFPEDPNAPVEHDQFTFRSLFFGLLIGLVINASNVYMSLKNGFASSSTLLGVIVGYAVLKWISGGSKQASTAINNSPFSAEQVRSTSAFKRFFRVRGYFGPKEHMLLVSTAAGAGSMGTLYATTLPVFYQLQLLGKSPQDDIPRLILLGLSTCFFGLALAMPLRKIFILKLKLPFIGDSPMAVLMHSFHDASEKKSTRRKLKYLGITFFLAFSFALGGKYAPGILSTSHFGWWLYDNAGWHDAVQIENFGWYVRWSPQAIGAGMLLGFRLSGSFLAGAATSWGLLAPLLVHFGLAFGIQAQPDKYPGWVPTYLTTQSEDLNTRPTPQYWMIWSAVLILFFSSVTEIFANGKDLGKTIGATLHPLVSRLKQKNPWVRRGKYHEISHEKQKEAIYDPVPFDERVPTWMWGLLFLVATALACIILPLQFHEGIGVTLLAVLLSIVFAFVAIDAQGRINNNGGLGPTVVSVALGGIAKGQDASVKKGAVSSTLGSFVASSSNGQAADVMGTLKISHLLGANLRVQFYGHIIGALFSTVVGVGVYVIFSNAFPCINSPTPGCNFAMPSIAPQVAITQAIFQPNFTLPRGSGWAALGFGIFFSALVIVKYFLIPPKYQHYVIDGTAFGVAFILGPAMPIAFFLGSCIGSLWRWRSTTSFAVLSIPVCIGLIAGEGISGLCDAILTMAGVGGDKHGSTKGCPGGLRCG